LKRCSWPKGYKENSAEEWIQFATIKNSEYEQWIGPNGNTYCENSTVIPYLKLDLSEELKRVFDSLGQSGK